MQHTLIFSMQQSHQNTLVPFASLSLISSTFNYLSKVLFFVMSLYLFALGFETTFHFGCDVPRFALKSQDVTLTRHTVHGGLQMANGILALVDAFFKRLTIAHPLVELFEITNQGQKPEFRC